MSRFAVACKTTAVFSVIALVCPVVAGAGNNAEVPVEDLRPGMVTVLRDPPVEMTRLEPIIALNLAANEALHPRLQPTGEIVQWSGYISILRPGPYRFSAMLRGNFRLQVAGKDVLHKDVAAATAQLVEGDPMRLEAGVHTLAAAFIRKPGAARLELFWEASHFRREPLPYDNLFHLPGQETAKLAHDALIERGRFLAEEHSCTRCHRPDDQDTLARGLLWRQGPDLSQIGSRVYAGWMDRWLEAPHMIRPGAAMPAMFPEGESGRVERYAVTRYLVSLGGPLKPETKPPKPEDLKRYVTRGERSYADLGCAACHGTEAEKSADKKGNTSKSNASASQIFPLESMGNKTTPEKLAAYLANPLALDPSGRMPNMQLSGDEARDLARFLCQAADRDIKHELPSAPGKNEVLAVFRRLEPRAEEAAAFERLDGDAQWLDLGKRLMIDKGCNNCHTIAPAGRAFANMLASASFSDIKQERTHASGCLADVREESARSPLFHFTASDRQALRVFLREGTSGAGSPAPGHAATVALERFNCLACHARNGAGGLTSALVDALRQVERADNSEAVMPPPLTGVGHKLRTPWLKHVLTQEGRARPWMSLRMPQFGEANVGWLPEALTALEGADADSAVHKVPITAAKVAVGRQLVGKSGFGCVSCHDIAGIPNTGTRGPDLASMDQRVRQDWYRRWLEQAQRMQPGTRMPTVFADGKSLLTQVLVGSADAQADAIWAYLSLGKNLPLPDGLEPPKGLILTVKDRPMVLRSFMPDAGARAIAVGYPGGVSVAFDAARCRLAYAWSGGFLDAAPVWNDRGGNPAKVLGARFWNAPPGCPWSVGSAGEPPDFAAQANDPAFGATVPEGQVYRGPMALHFAGYAVDKAGAPTFHYRIQTGDAAALEIQERPEPFVHGLGHGLGRHFALQLPAQTAAWFFAARANRPPQFVNPVGLLRPGESPAGLLAADTTDLVVASQEDGQVVVLDLTGAPEGAQWRIQRKGSEYQALLHLPPMAQAAHLDLHLKMWLLPRSEPELLHELLRIKKKPNGGR
jgi:cytochrome c553/cytochrome c551/c552